MLCSPTYNSQYGAAHKQVSCALLSSQSANGCGLSHLHREIIFNGSQSAEQSCSHSVHVPRDHQGLDLCAAAVDLQVWELYRFRNGQAPSSGVQFFEDVRLLMLSELTRERVYVSGQYGLARTQAIEQAISRISTSDMPQGVPAAISAARVEGSVEDVAGMGVGRDVDAVKILEASSGARSFLVDLETGCVLQKRGEESLCHVPSPAILVCATYCLQCKHAVHSALRSVSTS